MPPRETDPPSSEADFRAGPPAPNFGQPAPESGGQFREPAVPVPNDSHDPYATAEHAAPAPQRAAKRASDETPPTSAGKRSRPAPPTETDPPSPKADFSQGPPAPNFGHTTPEFEGHVPGPIAPGMYDPHDPHVTAEHAAPVPQQPAMRSPAEPHSSSAGKRSGPGEATARWAALLAPVAVAVVAVLFVGSAWAAMSRDRAAQQAQLAKRLEAVDQVLKSVQEERGRAAEQIAELVTRLEERRLALDQKVNAYGKSVDDSLAKFKENEGKLVAALRSLDAPVADVAGKLEGFRTSVAELASVAKAAQAGELGARMQDFSVQLLKKIDERIVDPATEKAAEVEALREAFRLLREKLGPKVARESAVLLFSNTAKTAAADYAPVLREVFLTSGYRTSYDDYRLGLALFANGKLIVDPKLAASNEPLRKNAFDQLAKTTAGSVEDIRALDPRAAFEGVPQGAAKHAVVVCRGNSAAPAAGDKNWEGLRVDALLLQSGANAESLDDWKSFCKARGGEAVAVPDKQADAKSVALRAALLRLLEPRPRPAGG